MNAHVARYWARTSDQIGYFLAGKAFIHGNWRLHGWTLTPPNFWTSDIPLSVLLFRLSRFSEGYENRGRLAPLGSIMLAMTVLAPKTIDLNQSTGAGLPPNYSIHNSWRGRISAVRPRLDDR